MTKTIFEEMGGTYRQYGLGTCDLLYVHFFDKTMYAMDRSGLIGEGIFQSSLERF